MGPPLARASHDLLLHVLLGEPVLGEHLQGEDLAELLARRM